MTPPEAVDSTRLPLGERARLEGRMANITERCPLTSCTQDLVRMTRTANCSTSELQELIQGDPSLVAQILRRVNSEFYGLDCTIRDLPKALRLPGCREILNLALTVRFAQMFRPNTDDGQATFDKLWEHCLAVAATARLVARVCDSANPADAYLAGLLHDVGLLMMHRCQPRLFQQVIVGVQHKEPTCVVETRIYQLDHAQLGAYAARTWGFESTIVDTLRHHHDPDDYTGPHRALVYVVCVADYLASRSGWPALGVHNAAVPPDCTYNLLELDAVAFQVICEELLPTLEKSGALA